MPSTAASSRLLRRVLAPGPVPELRASVDQGGGSGLRAARNRDPRAVIDLIAAAGLRGRGGAGFPTGRKWHTVCAHETGALAPPTIVVNGAEGEPGSFKDRAILSRDPYRVLEGSLIAAHAVGADTIVIALRASFDRERARVSHAIDEVRDAGWLDGIEVTVAAGPEEYLFGEETGLLEALDGRAPFPRITPPFRRGVEEIVDASVEEVAAAFEKGDDSATASAAGVELAGPSEESIAPPTLVNNVETLANVPGILAEGVEWFREMGTDESPGTLVCTITGSTVRAGVGEVEMGTSLREAIELVGGGVESGHRLRAALGGVSNAIIPERAFDTPLTYEDMATAGSGLGCGAFVVCDDRTDFAALGAGVARFLAVESCGQCTPCKRDGLALAALFDDLRRSETDESTLARIDDHLTTVTDGARCNLASQYQAVLGSVVDEFGDELRAHARGEASPAELVTVAPIEEIDGDRAVLETRHREKQPDWTYDPVWSGQSPADRLAGPSAPDPQGGEGG